MLNAQPETGAGSLSIIDTARNQVVATLALHRDPTALAVDPAGHHAYAANTGVELGVRPRSRRAPRDRNGRHRR